MIASNQNLDEVILDVLGTYSSVVFQTTEYE